MKRPFAVPSPWVSRWAACKTASAAAAKREGQAIRQPPPACGGPPHLPHEVVQGRFHGLHPRPGHDAQGSVPDGHGINHVPRLQAGDGRHRRVRTAVDNGQGPAVPGSLQAPDMFPGPVGYIARHKTAPFSRYCTGPGKIRQPRLLMRNSPSPQTAIQAACRRVTVS